MIEWISEAAELPRIGESVLLANPRQSGEFWDIETAWLMARYDGVVALPVSPGSRWPTDYAWNRHRHGGGFGSDGVLLITGNAWWARLDQIPLPPAAEHRVGPNGYPFVAQIGDAFIPMTREARLSI